MPSIKVKLSDFAADLNLPVQELADQLKKLDAKARKATSPLTDAEMNYLLEIYTQMRQVSSFDAYYADRSASAAPQPKEVKKPTRTAKPETVAKPKKTEPKKAEKAEGAAKPKTRTAPEKKTKPQEAPAAAETPAETLPAVTEPE